ncbi:MAG: hypothetical protein AAF530_14920 [Pseudomonadota bacterium]
MHYEGKGKVAVRRAAARLVGSICALLVLSTIYFVGSAHAQAPNIIGFAYDKIPAFDDKGAPKGEIGFNELFLRDGKAKIEAGPNDFDMFQVKLADEKTFYWLDLSDLDFDGDIDQYIVECSKSQVADTADNVELSTLGFGGGCKN